jgi:uncharacterized protein YcbX
VAEPSLGLVSDLWRFPVKSLGGERLRRAFIGPFGVLGDRRHAVVDERGEALSARRVSALLGFSARYAQADAAEGLEITTPTGAVVAPDDEAVASELWPILDGPARVVRSPTSVHDIAPIHIVTGSSLAELGRMAGDEEIDRRRFRANLVVEPESSKPFVEASWVGTRLQLGEEGPVLDVVSPTERCAVTTFDPDTLERRPEVHGAIARECDNFFGVYAVVVRPGWAAVGDTLTSLGDATAAVASSDADQLG